MISTGREWNEKNRRISEKRFETLASALPLANLQFIVVGSVDDECAMPVGGNCAELAQFRWILTTTTISNSNFLGHYEAIYWTSNDEGFHISYFFEFFCSAFLFSLLLTIFFLFLWLRSLFSVLFILSMREMLLNYISFVYFLQFIFRFSFPSRFLFYLIRFSSRLMLLRASPIENNERLFVSIKKKILTKRKAARGRLDQRINRRWSYKSKKEAKPLPSRSVGQ